MHNETEQDSGGDLTGDYLRALALVKQRLWGYRKVAAELGLPPSRVSRFYREGVPDAGLAPLSPYIEMERRRVDRERKRGGRSKQPDHLFRSTPPPGAVKRPAVKPPVIPIEQMRATKSFVEGTGTYGPAPKRKRRAKGAALPDDAPALPATLPPLPAAPTLPPLPARAREPVLPPAQAAPAARAAVPNAPNVAPVPNAPNVAPVPNAPNVDTVSAAAPGPTPAAAEAAATVARVNTLEGAMDDLARRYTEAERVLVEERIEGMRHEGTFVKQARMTALSTLATTIRLLQASKPMMDKLADDLGTLQLDPPTALALMMKLMAMAQRVVDLGGRVMELQRKLMGQPERYLKVGLDTAEISEEDALSELTRLLNAAEYAGAGNVVIDAGVVAEAIPRE
jgi:hypothetical protein